MSSVLEHRREYLRLMRQYTSDKGYFSVSDIQKAAHIPRSTAQDWINRLLKEGCVFLREGKRGRNAARYAAISSMPMSTCRRIFTIVDGDNIEIYHYCLSGACAAFCSYHHSLAGGVLSGITRDGTLLREHARIGSEDISIGLSPLPAVGVFGVERQEDFIIQYVRCIGGPAYSLSDMMARAEGVCRVETSLKGNIVEGMVWTKAMTRILIGIDDTDSKEGGATFALALALLNHVSLIRGVLPIAHHVAMLNPDIFTKTAGNSASCIEFAVVRSAEKEVLEKSIRFIADETFSSEWGIAIRSGLSIPDGLRMYANDVRQNVVTRAVAETTAERFDIRLIGGEGVIGALGAVALTGLPNEIMLDPAKIVNV